MTAKGPAGKQPMTGMSQVASGRRHPRNDLNDLTGTEWIKFTKSWFVCDSPRYHRNRDTELHPARFPEEMVAQFLAFFTKRGHWVLDPFAGSGSTLVACQETGRSGVGIEICERYARKAKARLAKQSLNGCEQHILIADSRRLTDPGLWHEAASAGLPVGPDGLPRFDFIITSPPYWSMLRTSRGGVFSTHKRRAATGLDTHYSDSPADLGNIQDYGKFIEELGRIFDDCARVLKDGKYLVIVVQNLRTPSGEVVPLAWDVAGRVSQTFQFQGERIWCQNSKRLGIWGYPKLFVPNYHHHYCLIFRK